MQQAIWDRNIEREELKQKGKHATTQEKATKNSDQSSETCNIDHSGGMYREVKEYLGWRSGWKLQEHISEGD